MIDEDRDSSLIRNELSPILMEEDNFENVQMSVQNLTSV